MSDFESREQPSDVEPYIPVSADLEQVISHLYPDSEGGQNPDYIFSFDPSETLILTPEEKLAAAKRYGRVANGSLMQVGMLSHALEQNLEDGSLPEGSPEQAVVDHMYEAGNVPRLYDAVRNKKNGAPTDALEAAKERTEAVRVLKELNVRMKACEDWLRYLGAENPVLKKRLSNTAFLPMAATGLLRNFDALWKNFWTIRLRRGLPIPENPPDERLLNQAASHAMRCEHSTQDNEFLQGLDFNRQLAIEYYAQISQFFNDPRNKKCEGLVVVIQNKSRYYRINLSRELWFDRTSKGKAIFQLEATLKELKNTEATEVSVEAQDALKTATYGKHKDVKKHQLLHKILGHQENEDTMVFLQAAVESPDLTLSKTVNSNRFFTGELATRVVRPVVRVDEKSQKPTVRGLDIGVQHRALDGVEAQDIEKNATSGYESKYGSIPFPGNVSSLPIEGIVDPRLASEEVSIFISPELFRERKIPLAEYKKIREKIDQLRNCYEVPKAVKAEMRCASSFTLPDLIQLAFHSMGMEAGQMVVKQRNSKVSLLDVAFSIANDQLLDTGRKIRNNTASKSDRQEHAKALLGLYSRFIREKSWSTGGRGTGSFFATLAGQKRPIEKLSNGIGKGIVGKRFVDGVGHQQFMVSVPTDTTNLGEKVAFRSSVTSFYSAQTDTLAMAQTAKKDGVGAVGVIDSPEDGLVLTIRATPDQSWITIQEFIIESFPLNDKTQEEVLKAYRELIFRGNAEPMNALKKAHSRSLAELRMKIDSAIDAKIQRQLEELQKQLNIVIDSLIQFADDHGKDKNNKFHIYSPNGELDGWKLQIQNEEQQTNRARGMRGALAGVWGSITGRRQE